MKRIIALMLAVVSLNFVFSCSKKNTLVINFDGKNIVLYESEYPDSRTMIEEVTNNKECRMLYLKDDELWFRDYEYTNQYLLSMNNGYFTGVDLGEFGGHCKYYQYFNADNAEGVLVTDESCYGLFSKSPTDNDNGYLISGVWNMRTTGTSKIHRLYRTQDSWKWETLLEFDSTPRCYLYLHDSNELYIATWKQLLKVSLDDCVVTVLSEHESLEYSDSIVKHNGKLYVGLFIGVLEYDLETGDTIWYSEKVYE